jgi:hypothetical protein
VPSLTLWKPPRWPEGSAQREGLKRPHGDHHFYIGMAHNRLRSKRLVIAMVGRLVQSD